MRPLLLVPLAFALTACEGAPSDDVPAPASPAASEEAERARPSDLTPPEPAASDPAPVANAAAPDAQVPGRPKAAPGPTTEQCRTEIGPSVSPEPLRLLAEHTFAARSPMHGPGCFVAAYDPVSLDESERLAVTGGAQDGVYPYVYTVTDATGDASTTLETSVGFDPDHHLRPVAVSFPDLNADGTDDVVVVHDECQPALAWTAFDDGWVHAPSLDGGYGLAACTAAEATAAYRAQLDESVSP